VQLDELSRLADMVMETLMTGNYADAITCFAPGATWSENGAPPTPVVEYFDVLRKHHVALGPRRHEDVRRLMCDDGFAEQHSTVWTGPDGQERSVAVCAVVRVGPDGLITSFDEYVDRSSPS
jgi:hypothetical protein